MNQTNLKILGEVAKGNCVIKQIALSLKKDLSQIYRCLCSLEGYISVVHGKIEPKKLTHVSLLLSLLGTYPNLVRQLSHSGIDLLISLQNPKTISEIMQETNLKRSTIYKKLKQAKSISLVTQKEGRFYLNTKIWPLVNDFLFEFKRYSETIDERVPSHAIIYYKNKKEIVFSLQQEFDARYTAFSAYELYGIKILNPTHYFYLPKKKLILKEVFCHSLYVAEKTNDIRHLIYVALFYIKYQRKLKEVKSFVLDKLKEVLSGKSVSNYPSFNEIKEKGEIYDINI